MVEFEDSCVIERKLGANEYDEPIMEVIYSGACCYQEGSYSNVQQMLVQNPILFLSNVSVLIEPNDSVKVKTKFGRSYNAIVARSREMELPITRERVTRLELIQATE